MFFKVGCPVVFQVKKIMKFPEFKISLNKKWQRITMSKKLKDLLLKIQLAGKKDNKVKQEGDVIKVPGLLQYWARFPKGKKIYSCSWNPYIRYSNIYFVHNRIEDLLL